MRTGKLLPKSLSLHSGTFALAPENHSLAVDPARPNIIRQLVDVQIGTVDEVLSLTPTWNNS